MPKLHPTFEQALAPFLKPIASRQVFIRLECDCEGRTHESNCRFNPDYDPTPWCSGCGAMRQADCHCGPLASNE